MGVQLESIPPETARPARVIGVAASAGGVEALRALVRTLPADLDAALCIVLHIPATGRSLLAPILDRVSALDVRLAEHGAPLEPGTIYVAPADHHLLIRADRIELSRGPKENGVRPAADPMFRSLARAWGSAAVAVVLSGALDDGAAGALAIAQAGGRVIVQDPEDALVPGMPASALAVGASHEVVPVAAMGELIARLAGTPISGRAEEADVSTEPDPAEMERGPNRPDGPASGFTCPECSGALWELREARAGALPLPRRALLLRGRDGRRAGHGRRGGAVDGARGARGAQRAAAADGEADGEPAAHAASASRTAHARPRSAPRSIRRILHSGTLAPLMDEAVAG